MLTCCPMRPRHDQVEQERLDIHHEIMLLIAGGDLSKAPVKGPHKVLDLGTGTGIWAVDYAFNHPETEVIGLDLRYVASRVLASFKLTCGVAV